MTNEPDGGPVTPEELEAARTRWADPGHEPSARELFARAVDANGVLGDCLIDPAAGEGE